MAEYPIILNSYVAMNMHLISFLVISVQYGLRSELFILLKYINTLSSGKLTSIYYSLQFDTESTFSNRESERFERQKP